MSETLKRPPLRTLTLISSPKLAEKAAKLLGENRIPLHYQLRGHGTASSEMMDMLGLGSTAKTVYIAMLPKPFAAQALARLRDELGLDKPNTGLAFTTAMTGISAPAMRMLDENIRKEWQTDMENDMRQMTMGSTYSLVTAAVNRGFSEEVMEAARKQGARGGTVLPARQAGGKDTMQFLGISVQEEKELVLILCPAETKLDLMKAIGEKCGIHRKAQGIVFSTPIDMIAGFDAK